ncbi:MAG: cation:proton antiporter [Candidatus Polarisedimenticolia bacterium]
MHNTDILRDLSIVFGASVLVVLVLHRLRLPTIAGFLVSGIVVGPHGLGLITDTARIETLAEAGVVLLLFTIGMEFSLATLRRLLGASLLGALLPLGAFSVMGALAAPFMGLQHEQGIFLGFLVSLSSTVIPLKALADRGQLDSPHGRAATGVAVLQDLLLIPMMLLTPYLAPGRAEQPDPVLNLVLALAQAGVVIGVLLVVALWLVPRLLERLADLQSREVFLISIFFICLGTAWLTSLVGLSLALGAFLAGLVISESEYGHQAMADMVPFRDSLTSLFFVSIGMLMDPSVLLERPAGVLVATLGIVGLKCALIAGTLLLIGLRPTVALQAGLALGQIGEFAFVLMRFGSGYGLIEPSTGSVFLAASVITMFVTPLVMAAAPPLVALVRGWEEKDWWRPARDLREFSEEAEALRDHVIVVGYGFNGRNLVRVLKEIGIPYVVLEMNPETVREARAEGERILYGDATSAGILERLGAGHARVLVLAISDPVSTRRAVALARRLFPALITIVRTRYLKEVDQLYGLGAQVVVPEEVETSMEIFSRVLEMYGVPRAALVKHARRIRAERYGLFRGGRPAKDVLAQVGALVSHLEARLVRMPPGARAAGRALNELGLDDPQGSRVLAVLRGSDVVVKPAPETRLAEGDGLVLLGDPESIGSAVEALLSPEEPLP